MRLAIALGLLVLMALPAAGQPQPFPIPQDPVVAYFESIVIPAMQSRVPAEKDLIGFYRTYVSIHSQVRVAEDQFVAYWQQVAQRVVGTQFWAAFLLGARFSLTYDIGEPVYNETRDQARFKVTVTITTHVGLRSTPENRVMFVHVIKESGLWKIVLSDDLVREMEKLPTKLTAPRYVVMREAAAKGVKLQVASLTIEKEMTLLDVTFDNTTDQPVDLRNSISAATLTDDTGKSYASRTLRSTLPEVAPAKQAVTGVLAFFPVPPLSRRLVLTFPELMLGKEIITLSIEITLR